MTANGWLQIAIFFLLVLACAFLFPSRYLIMTDVVRLAREYTAQRFPGDAITLAAGANP